MKYIFAVNPKASGTDTELLEIIESSFIRGGNGDSFSLCRTESAGEAKELAAACAEKYGSGCVVTACGGGSLVRECAEGLAYTEAALAILPMGHCNDAAMKLYGSDDPYRAAERMGFLNGNLHAAIRRTDLGRCGDRLFMSAVSIGFDARAAVLGERVTEKLKIKGKAARRIGLAAALAEGKSYSAHADITVSTTANGITRTYPINRELKFSQLAVCNTGCCNGFEPSADSVLNDGVFELFIAEPMKFTQRCNVAPMYRMGAADASGRVRMYSFHGGSFWRTDGEKTDIFLDGEHFSEDIIKITAERKAIRLCTPIR